jgi:hypothetical protein
VEASIRDELTAESAARAGREVREAREVLDREFWGDELWWKPRASGIERARAKAGPRGKAITDDQLRTTVEAYREELRAHPHEPIKALAAKVHRDRRTVHRWLKAARERGLMDEEE